MRNYLIIRTIIKSLNCKDSNAYYVGKTFKNFNTSITSLNKPDNRQSHFANYLKDNLHDTGFKILFEPSNNDLLLALEALEIDKISKIRERIALNH